MLDNYEIGKWYTERINCLLILAMGATFCTLPLLLHKSLPLSQDIVFHIFQADQFNQNLWSGVLYPRWTGGAVNGYGSPNFIFYSPLSYYLVALLHYIMSSLITSMAVAIWFCFLLSGTTMLLLVKHFFAGYRALIPAVLYQILPFHLYELYVRGAFAGLFAYIWFPVILMLICKIHESKKSAICMCYLSIAYAALIMTHLVSAFMFTLIIVVVILYFLFAMQHGTALKITGALGCGLGLASIYFIPVLLERKYVHIDYLINGPLGKYSDNYLFTPDILHLNLSNFYLWLHLEVIADLVFFAIIYYFVKNRRYCAHNSIYRVFTFLFLLSFFFTIPLSKPFTDFLPGLYTIQFPWRWIAIMEVLLAFLSSYLFSTREEIRKPFGMMNQSAILLLFILLSVSMISKSKTLTDNNVAKLEHSEQLANIMDPITEYIPIWVQDWRGLNLEPVSFVVGKGTLVVNHWKPQNRIIKCMTPVPSKLRIATFYYPGWDVKLDGMNVLPNIEKVTGAILVNIPQGKHIVKLQFVNTPIRCCAQWVSIVFLFFLFAFSVLFHSKEF